MPGTFGLTLAAFFFIVIPGVVGVKFFLRSYVRLDSLTRIDKLVFSGVAGSAILLFFLTFSTLSCSLYAFVQDGLTGIINGGGTCGGVTNSSFSDFAEMPALILLLFAGIETSIAGVVGRWLGDNLNRIEPGATREDKYIEQPWEFASRRIIREDTKATVITSDGDSIRGTVHRLGAPSENSNLLLKDPIRTVYDQDKGEVRREGNIAPFSYHHHLDISQVYFDSLSEEDDLEGDEEEDELEDLEGEYDISEYIHSSKEGVEDTNEISFEIITDDSEQTDLTEDWPPEDASQTSSKNEENPQ